MRQQGCVSPVQVMRKDYVDERPFVLFCLFSFSYLLTFFFLMCFNYLLLFLLETKIFVCSFTLDPKFAVCIFFVIVCSVHDVLCLLVFLWLPLICFL